MKHAAAIGKYVYLAGYSSACFLACLILVVFGIVSAMEALHVYALDTAALEAEYPFGTEQGFSYRSKEIYFYTQITGFAISLQGLLFAACLFFLKRKGIALSVMCFTIGILYGLDCAGDTFSSKAQ